MDKKKSPFAAINKKYMVILGILLLLLLLFKKILVIGILSVASFFVSYFINNLQIRTIGLELATLAAVLSGKAYGPITGFIVGFVLILFHLIMSGYVGMYFIWVIPSYAIVGLMAGVFSGVNIVTLGIISTILLNIVYLSFTLMTSPERLMVLLPYSVTNVIINVILFTTIAQPLLSIIK
ncbi:MAG: hypothetical protein V1859_00655 [archaeon]